MKIEKLRNNHKKEIIIGTILTVIIGGALTFRLTHSKYRVTQSIDLGSGVINYKPYDFKIMAIYQQKDGSTCTEDNCYNEITDRMPSTGYVINTSKSYCTLDNINHDNEVELYTNEGGEHVFKNLKKSDKCYLYFDKTITVDDIIAANNPKTTTLDFSKTATTDEGVYSTSDGMYGGTTYYWRGAVTNNHVIFANNCWRIVRINGDKTMRLIYNGSVLANNTCFGNGSNDNSIAVAGQAYNSSSNQSNYVGWTYSGTSQRTLSGTSSNAKSQTESWYNNNLSSYDTFIANGKFCNNRNAGNGYRWAISPDSTFYYEEHTNMDNATPSISCPSGDEYTLKVGAITASEVIFAGGTASDNDKYYLYNGQYYWTMSPYWWYSGYAYASVFYVYPTGCLSTGAGVDYTILGLRPVINLKSDVTFSSGNGLQNSPYIVES